MDIIDSNDQNALWIKENMLRSQREWEATVDSLDQLVLIVDSMGIIVRGNRVVETWKLGNVKEIGGIHFHRLVHPECQVEDCYLKKAWENAQEKLGQNEPYHIENKDHILNRFISLQFRPISLEKSRLRSETTISVVLIFQDITNARVTLTRIKQAASEMSSIFQFVPDSYIRLDSLGNIRAYKSGGTSNDFFINRASIGKNINDIIPIPLKPTFTAAMEKAKKTKSLEVFEYTHNSPKGKQVYEARIIPLFKNQVNIINRNITENKRLLQIAETMNLMENLGYIFSGIRHEIGNPINSIKMAMSVLKNNLDKFPKERVSEYVDRVLAEVNRVEYLLKNLKNFNMFEELNPGNIQVLDFMSKFISLVKNDLEKKGIRINSHISPDVKEAFVDSRAFHQVLLNIISNSSEALDGIKDPIISLITGKAPGKIWLKIIDNGHGIEESNKKMIFKPFFTTKPHGTGIGLNIVQKIVHRMEGTIEIESWKNIGTTVTITIPEGHSGTS